jgi:glutamyl-tRNA synthetase
LNLFYSILSGELANYNLVKSKPLGKIMQPFRLSLVGALKGPHLFDIVELIGKEETVKRIEKAILKL